ncbi:MAG: BON domain-containing protein [Betaproteobacteria bacterium]|nr:MAG: BON domain-containing protein [Betaproteobacteria bacterium]
MPHEDPDLFDQPLLAGGTVGVRTQTAQAEDRFHPTKGATDESTRNRRIDPGARPGGLRTLKIDVDSEGNTVTLNGVVDSEGTKQRAATVARSVQGVAAVKNNLTVKSGG